MFGKDALDQGFTAGIYPSRAWMAARPTDCLSAARVYIVAPAFVHRKMHDRRDSVFALINSVEIKDRVTEV